MKVIDIFNKIANGEEVRFRLLCDNDIFYITKDCFLYNETQEELAHWYIDVDWLNEEVEIIEEKKIPEKLPTNKLGTVSDIKDKINEIIDYLESKGE